MPSRGAYRMQHPEQRAAVPDAVPPIARTASTASNSWRRGRTCLLFKVCFQPALYGSSDLNVVA